MRTFLQFHIKISLVLLILQIFPTNARIKMRVNGRKSGGERERLGGCYKKTDQVYERRLI